MDNMVTINFSNSFMLIFVFMSAIIAFLTFTSIYFFNKYFNINKKHNKLHKQQEFYKSSLKHDLKIQTLAQMHALEIFPKLIQKEKDEIYSELVHSCKNSFETITTLLSILEIDEKTFELNCTNFNLRKLIEDIKKQNEHYLKEKELTLNTTLDENINNIWGDEKNLKIVISFLIQVASTLSDKRSFLDLTINPKNNNICFSLKYSHAYENEKEHLKILDENPIFSAVGHGMKINFCKKILDLHNSTLKSKSDKDSCTVYFSLPNTNKNNLIPKQTSNNKQFQIK